MDNDRETKTRTAVWFYPSTLRHIDAWLIDDNCKTRSEFIEKAVRFYLGYLSTGEQADYLSKTLVALIRGMMEEHNNRMRGLIFKLCVEVNMAIHTIAAHFHADEINRRELRAFAVEEVKRTNGRISFDRAIDIQSQPYEEEDEEWRS